MGKIFFIVVFICFYFFPLSSQTIIKMEKSNGVYKIPCVVNGARMKFIFDTGATNVSMSASMANYLLENEYISKEDIIKTGQSSLADGRIIDHTLINLKDIEISGLHLNNIETIVLNSQNAPLLLGQSAIQKLGKIEIDGDILKILEHNELNEGDIQQVLADATIAFDDGLYEKAKNCYEKVYAFGRLSDYGKYCYVRACMHCKDFTKAYSVINEINDFNYFEEQDINIYSLFGWVYEYNNKYDEAISYYKKSFEFPSASWKEKAMDAESVAFIYEKKKDYQNAYKYYRGALLCYGYEHNVDEQYLLDDCYGKLKRDKKSYRDDDIDYCAFKYIDTAYNAGIYSNKDYLYLICLLAKNGNKDAVRLCNRAKIDFDEFLNEY